MNRRQFIAGAAALVPLSSVRAAGPVLTPEAFGAVGDGTSDDYPAFQRLAAAASKAGSAVVSLSRGRSYFLRRHVSPGSGAADIIFSGCSGLVIDGNGATVSVDGSFMRTSAAIRSLCGLRFEDCANVAVRNIELVGNVDRMTRTPGLGEAPSHGLLFGGCSDVSIDNVTARHFAGDGMYVRASARPDARGAYRASRRFQVRNSRFLFNARQGLSVIQLRDATFEQCDFSFSGSIDEASHSSRYGAHSPIAGVDVEPNSTPWAPRRPVDVLTGNLRFSSCRMIRNLGGAFLAGQVSGDRSTIENVIVENCLTQASEISPSRYGLIFDVPGGVIRGCTLRMSNKTAFIGWYAQSRANPVFSGNIVYGDSAPILVVRPTHGVPTVDRNRFIGQPGQKLLRVDNPQAIVRDNIMS